MKEKLDELYDAYLKEKLDLIFSFHGEKKENEISKVRVIEKDGKYNIIDENGKILSSLWFDKINEFNNGCARVLITTKTMDKQGKLVTNTKMNLIDTNGRLISEEWYDNIVGFFQEGFIQVEKDGKSNYIDVNGKLLCDEWYDDVDGFHNGFSLVRKKSPHYESRFGSIMPYKFDAIDNTGKRIFGNWNNSHSESEKINNSFVRVYIEENKRANEVVCTTKNLNGYKVKRFLNGYSCSNGNDKFNIKYEPLRIYDSRNIICYDKKSVYLFDRNLGKYTRLGSVPYIEFNENFIFDLENKKTYFVYEGQVHDITKYYNKIIKGKENITINKGIAILSKDAFYIKQEERIKKEATEAKKEKEKAIERAKLTEEEKQLLDSKEQDEKKEKEREIHISEAVKSIIHGVKVLEQYEKENKKIDRIQVTNLFVSSGDHKEINPLYIETGLLKYIDLSMVSFKNVKISGVDFRGSNIVLKPQEVYSKDLSGCNFEGLYIDTFMDFSGVDIRGTRFSRDDDPKTLDMGSATFSSSIYDETTTFNGIPFTMIYNKEEKTQSR